MFGMLDVYDNKLILKSEMEKFLLALCVQSYDSNENINSILNDMYGDKIFLRQEELKSVIFKSGKLINLFTQILQDY